MSGVLSAIQGTALVIGRTGRSPARAFRYLIVRLLNQCLEIQENNSMTQNDDILDAPISPKEKPAYNKWLRGIAIGIEGVLWAIGVLGLLFKLESWEGASELLILSLAPLSLFYLFFTFLITGSRGRQQVLGAIGAGFVLSILVTSVVFVAEFWTFGTEMQFSGLILGVIAAITTFYFLIQAGRAEKSTGFYWNVLARLAVILIVMA